MLVKVKESIAPGIVHKVIGWMQGEDRVYRFSTFCNIHSHVGVVYKKTHDPITCEKCLELFK
jgi:hypothetical protein